MVSFTLLQYSHSKLPEGVINTGVSVTHAHMVSFTLLQYSHSKLPEGVINTGVSVTHAHMVSLTLLQYSHSKLPEGVINTGITCTHGVFHPPTILAQQVAGRGDKHRGFRTRGVSLPKNEDPLPVAILRVLNAAAENQMTL